MEDGLSSYDLIKIIVKLMTFVIDESQNTYAKQELLLFLSEFNIIFFNSIHSW